MLVEGIALISIYLISVIFCLPLPSVEDVLNSVLIFFNIYIGIYYLNYLFKLFIYKLYHYFRFTVIYIYIIYIYIYIYIYIIIFTYNLILTKQKYITFRSLNCSNINYLKKSLFDYDWKHIYDDNDPNSAFESFCKIYTDLYFKHCPLIKKKTSDFYNKPWISDNLKKCIAKKNKFYKCLLKNNNAFNKKKIYIL